MKNKKVVKKERPEADIDDQVVTIITKKVTVVKPWLLEKTVDNKEWTHNWWHKFETSDAALEEMNTLCRVAIPIRGKTVPNPYFHGAKGWRLRHESTNEILELKLSDNTVIINQ